MARPLRPVATLCAAAVPLAALAFGLGWAVAPEASPLAPVSALLLLAAVALALPSWPHPVLGPANLVTAARGAMAMSLVPAIAAPPSQGSAAVWVLTAVSLLVLALDGVDGALARRSGLAGPWGARLDVEVDSVFAGLLSLAVWRSGEAGAWILLLGTMRYVFVAAALPWPWLGGPLPERRRRKAVCVAQIGTLIALLSPVVAPPHSAPLALAALALLVWSFLSDVAWLARR